MSIVDPSTSFSVVAKVNDTSIVFLLDTGSALTILRKDVWERCKLPTQQEQPWNQKRLVGAGGTLLHVYGWAAVEIDVKGEKFSQSVVIVDPLATEAILGLDVLKHCVIDLSHEQLITGAGHVVPLYCKEQNKKQDMIHKQDKKQDNITQAESVKTDPVLFVRVASNAMIPSFSEMEILGTIMGQAPDKSYLLQGQLKNSDLMIAAAVV